MAEKEIVFEKIPYVYVPKEVLFDAKLYMRDKFLFAILLNCARIGEVEACFEMRHLEKMCNCKSVALIKSLNRLAQRNYLAKGRVENGMLFYTIENMFDERNKHLNASVEAEFREFLNARREMGKPVPNKYAEKKLIERLFELSKNPNEQKKIIERSTICGWLNFYPLTNAKD